MHLLTGEALPFERTLFPLHIAPVFIPFTKIGSYENTDSVVRVYTKAEGDGYRLRSLEEFIDTTPPYAVWAPTSIGIAGFARQDALGRTDAARAVVRKTWCERGDRVSDISDIRIVVSQRSSGVVTEAYDISCTP